MTGALHSGRGANRPGRSREGSPLTDTTYLPTDERSVAVDPKTDAAAAAAPTKPRRRSGGLSGMVLPELHALAADLGIGSTAKMRKSELIAAITTRQSDPATAPAAQAAAGARSENGSAGSSDGPSRTRQRRSASRPAGAPDAESLASEPTAAAASVPVVAELTSNGASPTAEVSATAPAETTPASATEVDSSTSRPADSDGSQPPREYRQREPRQRARSDRQSGNGSDRPAAQDRNGQDRNGQDRSTGQNGADRQNGSGASPTVERTGSANGDRAGRDRSPDRAQERTAERSPDRNQDRSQDRNQDRGPDREEEDDGTGRRRRGRFRERNRRPNRERFGGEPEPVVADDDVLIPVAGIVDILDNYGFIRTSGYLTGPNDVYVSMAQVKKYGVRRGDAVTGAVKQPREGDRKDKYNALVRMDTVNGMDPEEAKKRPEFHRLTPLYPQERLRLETEAHLMTTRVIDLVMPIGKGQRALIVSPPKAGKTMVLQAIANAITTNNPECHLMVVLVDERPEEVTDMTRSVKGEVIASTFDRPPTDHTTVAELSIERAKRLVELGHDVVVLLDSITRLGRAYNLAAPASGRILSGGVDSTALYPPKRFLGAARNIENGGSLTIMATALVETGSTMDTVIFEEFKGTGNAELKLDRKIADKRVFPAIDVDPSGTRKEELLLSPEELSIVIKLRRVLHALDPQQALELLLDRMRKTSTNAEFLMQIQKTTVGPE